MTKTPAENNDPTWLRLAVDFGGLAAFAITYLVTRSLVAATWAIVAGSATAVLVGLIFEKRLAPLPLIVGVFGLIFGGLTVATGDDKYIKMEGSFLYFGLGAGLMAGVWMRRNPLKPLLGSALHMSDGGWRKLTIRYAVFFLFLGIINEVVRQKAGNDVFSGFKIVKFAITMIFSVCQVPLIMKEMEEQENAAKTDEVPPAV